MANHRITIYDSFHLIKMLIVKTYLLSLSVADDNRWFSIYLIVYGGDDGGGECIVKGEINDFKLTDIGDCRVSFTTEKKNFEVEALIA